MPHKGLGRDQVHATAWQESYPHPLVSCLMPLSALLGILAAVLFGIHLWQISLPRDVTIPLVVGIKSDDAGSELHRAGLEANIVDQGQASETVPAGAILTQEPAGGQRVKIGRIIRLVLSTGSAFTLVPDVRELAEAAATERLLGAGLQVGAEDYVFHKTIPFDRVIEMTPHPGMKVEKNTAVHLVLSKGAESPDTADNTPSLRSTVVSVKLPSDVTTDAEARIDVTDEDGKRTVFQQTRHPGDTLVETVQGNGDMTIEVYFNDHLLLTRKF